MSTCSFVGCSKGTPRNPRKFRLCLGEFLAQCQRAGFVQRSATPHKNRKFEAHPSEGANRQLEAQMRLNLVGSRRLFEHWDLDARDCWDRAVKHGARQIAVRTHCRTHDVAHDQMKRELLAPGFGASGMVKIQEGDTSHRQPGGKQLADRSVQQRPGGPGDVGPSHPHERHRQCTHIYQPRAGDAGRRLRGPARGRGAGMSNWTAPLMYGART